MTLVLLSIIIEWLSKSSEFTHWYILSFSLNSTELWKGFILLNYSSDEKPPIVVLSLTKLTMMNRSVAFAGSMLFGKKKALQIETLDASSV